MTSSPWLRDLFRPLVVMVLVGLVTSSVVSLIGLIAPAMVSRWLVPLAMVAASESHYSHRLLQVGERLRGERIRFRLVELGMLILGGRLFLLLAGGAVGREILRASLRDPLLPFSTGESVLSIVVILVAWDFARRTSADLDRADAPLVFPLIDGKPPKMSLLTKIRLAPLLAAEPYDPDRLPPLESLRSRFYSAGALLFVSAGISRIGMAALLDVARPAVPGLILSVLAYFVLVFLLLGQVHYAALQKRWQSEETPVESTLGQSWVLSSVVFFALVALVAFLLPTGFSLPLLEGLASALLPLANAVIFVMMLIFVLATYPILLLLWAISRLFGSDQAPPSPSLPQTPLVPPPAENAAPPEWYLVLRSLVVVLILVTILVTIVRLYLKDHPELVESLRTGAPLGWLLRLVALLRRWLRRGGQVLAARLPILTRLFNPARPTLQRPLFRRAPRDARGRLRALYLSLVDRMAAMEPARRANQTPHEYRERLGGALPEVADAVDGLTEAFVAARYSRHEIDDQRLAAAQADLRQIERALARREAEKAAGDNGGDGSAQSASATS